MKRRLPSRQTRHHIVWSMLAAAFVLSAAITNLGKMPFVRADADVNPHMLKNIDTSPAHAETEVDASVNMGGIAYFSYNDSVHGLELWKSDGTPEGTQLVKDIEPGSDGSDIDHLTVVGSELFFTAYDDDNGTALWKSDGTEGGTVMVENALQNYDYFAALDNTLYFAGDEDRKSVV